MVGVSNKWASPVLKLSPAQVATCPGSVASLNENSASHSGLSETVEFRASTDVRLALSRTTESLTRRYSTNSEESKRTRSSQFALANSSALLNRDVPKPISSRLCDTKSAKGLRASRVALLNILIFSSCPMVPAKQAKQFPEEFPQYFPLPYHRKQVPEEPSPAPQS